MTNNGVEKQAEQVVEITEAARENIESLISLGGDVQIVLHLSDQDDARNSLEIGPADRRARIYYNDLDDLKHKLDEIQQGREYAEDLGIVAPKGGSK